MESPNADVGIIGCGYISGEYLDTFEKFDTLDVVACGDIHPGAAEETAGEYGIELAGDVDVVLEHPDVDVVVNLTPPDQHADVSEDVLRSGKHLYVEKPFAASTTEARRVLELADDRNLLTGCAPDMFIGPVFQSCRSFIDTGEIGEVTGASLARIGPGHESWHPNPAFYYQRGGGPLFDFGPYYITPLISFLGPARWVSGHTTTPTKKRMIEVGPREGERIDVEVPTDEIGTISFGDDVMASIRMSFEAQTSSLPAQPASVGHLYEIYGSEGTLVLSNPSNFNDPIRYRREDDDEWQTVPVQREFTAGRGIGVLDLVYAAKTDWEQRVSGELAFHVLDVMESIRRASDEKRHVELSSTVSRPAPVTDMFP